MTDDSILDQSGKYEDETTHQKHINRFHVTNSWQRGLDAKQKRRQGEHCRDSEGHSSGYRSFIDPEANPA